jgi:hypothetical protein
LTFFKKGNIVERNYVAVSQSGRKLEPTRLGIVLVHGKFVFRKLLYIYLKIYLYVSVLYVGYHRIDPDAVLPTVRAHIERLITMIAKGLHYIFYFSRFFFV